jgi:hypothetical protein
MGCSSSVQNKSVAKKCDAATDTLSGGAEAEDTIAKNVTNFELAKGTFKLRSSALCYMMWQLYTNLQWLLCFGL